MDNVPQINVYSNMIDNADKKLITPGPGSYKTAPEFGHNERKEGKVAKFVKRNNKFPSAFGSTNKRFGYN